MKIKDMALNSLCKALLPTITNCYFSNRQKLDKGDSMEIVTANVAAEILKLMPTAEVHDVIKAFEMGAGGDFESDGNPPYLTPMKFRFFVKKYYDQKLTVNAQQEDDAKALPYFSTWEERQSYHITQRYEQILQGLRVFWFDAYILWRFLEPKRLVSATEITDSVVKKAKAKIAAARYRNDIFGFMRKVQKIDINYNQLENMCKWIVIEELVNTWRLQGLSVAEVQQLLKN